MFASKCNVSENVECRSVCVPFSMNIFPLHIFSSSVATYFPQHTAAAAAAAPFEIEKNLRYAILDLVFFPTLFSGYPGAESALSSLCRVILLPRTFFFYFLPYVVQRLQQSREYLSVPFALHGFRSFRSGEHASNIEAKEEEKKKRKKEEENEQKVVSGTRL